MAISFTLKFNGQQISYNIQMFFGVTWILIGVVRTALHYLARNRSIAISPMLPAVLLPWILFFLLTFVLWSYWPPALVDTQYFGRVVNNGMLIVIAILNAYVGSTIFGRDVIKLSFYALVLTIVVNFVIVVPQFGFSTFAAYLPTVVQGDFTWQSPLWALADKLETQGPTMTMGIYALYFMWFDKDDTQKHRWISLCIALICLYIGFKRTALVALLLVSIFMWIIMSRHVRLNSAINVVGWSVIVFFGGYVYLLDSGILEHLANIFGIDMMGRDSIYGYLVQLFSFNPLYVGKGFTYISKTMYDTVGYEAHSDIVRLYGELGFIPFFIWMYHYLVVIPKLAYKHYGTIAGRVALVAVLYVFGTFLTENTLMTYSMEYALAVFCFIFIKDAKEASSFDSQLKENNA